MGTNAAILNFMEKQTNLATAYNVRDWLKDAERHIFETFWSQVRGALDQRLAELGCHEKWKVTASASLFEGTDSYIAVTPRLGQDNMPHGRRYYSIAAEQFGGESGSCYFGVFRGMHRYEPLDRSLEDDGFRPSAFWSGYRYFNSLNLPDFRLDRDSVMSLNADIQSSERPLVHAVAAQMLTLFEKYYVLLEQLNGVT